MRHFSSIRGQVILLATLAVIACNTFLPGNTLAPATATAPPSPTAGPAPSETPRPTRTPVVFQTNTAVPRATATPSSFVQDVFGLDRRDTLLLIGLPPAPAGLDPAVTTGAADGYVGHLFSGLVRLSPELEVEPDLAESWSQSPDGRVYTFTLRGGLTFASGKLLTAADVQYSWERAANPATGSTTAAIYLGDIAGVRARVDGTAQAIAGLAVLDDYTLVVTLDQPRTQFLAKLTYPVAFVVDRENVADGPRWMLQPNASGPFALRAFRADQAMVFERNPGYHTPAGVQNVVYLFVPFDMGGPLYEAGEIDIGFLDAQTAARVRDESDPLHAHWLTTTSLCTIMLRLDITRPPLDDPQVRLALVLGLDRATLRTNLAGSEALLADTVLPPGLPGYTAGQPRFAFDLAQAQAALAASRYAGQMPPVVLADSGTPAQPSALGAAVAAMWRSHLGLEVTIEHLASSVRPATPEESLGHAVIYNWCADYPDPENFLEVLFHSSSAFNISAYANPQVDAWLEAARADPDPAHRFDLFRQAEAQILTDVAVIPWVHPTYERLVQPHVRGYVLAPMGAPIIHRVSLAWPEE